jgi:transketolase
VTREEKKALETAACRIRMGIIESTHGAKSGHPGGSLSAADVFAYLYFKELRIDPQDPAWPQRDRFVLSKGPYRARALLGARAQGVFSPVRA